MKRLLPRLCVCTALVVLGSLFCGSETSADEINLPHADLWFLGPIDAAFVLAKKENRPIFLYWGAKWCPSCKEMQQRVFITPTFRTLIQPLVPVYLDGDTAAAQQWGDKLGVSTYPTLLLFDGSGKELLRINSELSLDEFKQAFSAALQSGATFEVLIDRARQKTATVAQWQLLAAYSWDQMAKADDPHRLALLQLLVDHIPAALKKERAALLIKLFETAVTLPPTPQMRAQITAALPKILRQYGGSSLSAIKTLVLYQTETFWKWFANRTTADLATANLEKHPVFVAWRQAAQKIRKPSKTTSFETELMSYYPELTIWQLSHPQLPSKQFPQREVVLQHIERTLPKLKTPEEKFTTVLIAADLWQELGEFDRARKQLQAAAQNSPVPWIFYSTLAGLEEKANDAAAALKWSVLAQKTATGDAAQIQWSTKHLLLTLKLNAKKNDATTGAAIRAYYDKIFAVSDGFMGRNWRRLQAVAGAIKANAAAKDVVKSLIPKYTVRCAQLKGDSRARCNEHFSAL